MAGLLGNLDDPQSQGLLSAALAMLAASGPSPQRTSIGQVLGAGGAEGLRSYNAARMLQQRDEELRRRNALVDLQMRKMEQAEANPQDPTAPASVREWEFFNKLPPEQQSKFLEMKRQMWQPGVIGEVPHMLPRGAGMQPQPMSTLSAEAQAKEVIAGAKERGTQAMRSQFTLDDVYNPDAQRMEKRPRSMLLPPVQSAGERARLQQGVFAQEGTQDSPYANGPSAQPLPFSWSGVPAGPSATEKAKGEASAKRMTEAPQKIKSMESAIDRSGLVLKKIDDAINSTGAMTTGPGSVLDFMPGSPARNYKGTIDTIIANIGFKELQNMRFESPTGGALGQVAVQELTMLQAVLSSLDRAQAPSQMKQNLGEIKAQYEGAIGKLRRAINAEKHFLETGQDIGQSDPLGIRQ